MSPPFDDMAVVIPFPQRGAPESPVGREDLRFLLRTAQVLEDLADGIGDELGVLRLHTAVDLRRPRLRRLLSRLAGPESRNLLDELDAVSDRSGLPIEDQLLAARGLVQAVENAATG